MELTGGEGIDVILEMLANVNLRNDLPMLAKSGRVVVIGSRGDVQITPRDLMGRDAAILGMSLLNTSKEKLSSIHAFLVAGLENGTLRPVVGKELPLAEAVQAHHLIMESSAYGKIVLIP
jgi:NADPH2:quinone reductase